MSLFAANDDIIQILIIVIITVLAGIGQLLSKLKQNQQQPQKDQPPQGQPPAAGPRPQQAKRRPVSDDVADEIDEFLRRAQKRRSGARPAREKPRSKAAEKPVAAEIVESKPVGGRVAEHVQKHLDEKEFIHRGDQLGKGVVNEVQREIDQHVQQAFEHSVGQLTAQPESSATVASGTTTPELTASVATENALEDEWTGLFADPGSIRQAIVLNEILTRPEQRWASY